MTPIVYLDQQVKQACPNAQGVSIGRWENKRTWRITGPVTQQEQDAAQAIFATFDKAAFEASQTPVKTVEQEITELKQRLAQLESK